MRKVLLLLFFSMLYGFPAWSQTYTSGGITAVDTSATCSTTGGFVVVNVIQNASSVAFSVSGTFSATLQFVGTVDGTSWVSVNAFPPNSGTAATSTTAPGTWKADVSNFSQFCVRASAYVSGTATVGMRNGQGVSTSTLGGGTPLTPASNFDTSGVYVSTNPCGSLSRCFQVNANVLVSENASWTNTQSTVTTLASDPAFVAATDVGKVEFGTSSCPGTDSNCTYSMPQGTISTVNSAHSVTVSGSATATTSGAANATNFFWGTDDGPTLVNAFAALFPNTFSTSQLQPQPQKNLYLPCGMMFASVSPFVTPAAATGNMANGGGISGCGGAASTVIVPLPKMNCAVGGCLFGNTIFPLIQAGFPLPGWHLRDFTFWGGGTDVKDSAATYGNPAVGIYMQFTDEIDNVWVIGWVWNQANTYGINNIGGTSINSGSVAGGKSSCANLGNTAQAISTWVGGSCGGSGGASFVVNNSSAFVSTHGMYINQVLGAGTGCLTALQVLSGFYTDFGSSVTTGMCLNSSTSLAYMNGSRVNQSGGGNSAITISNGIVHLNSVNVQATGGAINQTGGTVYDDCGNGVLPGTASVISNLYGDCSVTGVANVAGNEVLTSGWGTANVNTLSGSVRDVFFTISVTGGSPGASPVLTETFATPFWGTPKPGCWITQTGGNTGDISVPVFSSLSRTGVAITWTGTPVSGHSYTFWRHCANS